MHYVVGETTPYHHVLRADLRDLAGGWPLSLYVAYGFPIPFLQVKRNEPISNTLLSVLCVQLQGLTVWCRCGEDYRRGHPRDNRRNHAHRGDSEQLKGLSPVAGSG